MNTVRDPHHAGAIEWKLESGLYYQRPVGCEHWTRVKRMHLTPARIAALATLKDENA